VIATGATVIRFEPLVRCFPEGCESLVEARVARCEFHRDKGGIPPGGGS
jgi:hypothetical protein